MYCNTRRKQEILLISWNDVMYIDLFNFNFVFTFTFRKRKKKTNREFLLQKRISFFFLCFLIFRPIWTCFIITEKERNFCVCSLQTALRILRRIEWRVCSTFGWPYCIEWDFQKNFLSCVQLDEAMCDVLYRNRWNDVTIALKAGCTAFGADAENRFVFRKRR